MVGQPSHCVFFEFRGAKGPFITGFPTGTSEEKSDTFEYFVHLYRYVFHAHAAQRQCEVVVHKQTMLAMHHPFALLRMCLVFAASRAWGRMKRGPRARVFRLTVGEHVHVHVMSEARNTSRTNDTVHQMNAAVLLVCFLFRSLPVVAATLSVHRRRELLLNSSIISVEISKGISLQLTIQSLHVKVLSSTNVSIGVPSKVKPVLGGIQECMEQ